jgi:GMP synthase-like glutamine amidotransferase
MSPEAIAVEVHGRRSVRLLVVQHDPDKPLGRIADVLISEGAALDVRMADNELPSLRGYGGLVVLPGLANPDDDHPPLHRARDAIREALDAGVPVLGLCLGGQLLVQALGGATYRSRDELGFREVRTTAAAGDDPLLGAAPSRFRPFHAHAYAFTPPPDAVVLLENEVCVQACRLGESWAFQCHPEPTVAWISALASAVRGRANGVDPRTSSFFRDGGIDPDELEADARAADETAARVARGIASGFAERCRLVRQ